MKSCANTTQKNADILSRLAARGETKKVLSLLKHDGVNPNAHDKTGWTALHWASQEGQLRVVKLLIKCGAVADPSDALDYTPLLAAVGEGHAEVVGYLLQAGADVNRKCKSQDNGSPLGLAAAWNRLAVARRLVAFGANINAEDSAGRTPLYFAVMCEHVRMARFLIENGACVDLERKDREEGKTLLELAKDTRKSILVKLLTAAQRRCSK